MIDYGAEDVKIEGKSLEVIAPNERTAQQSLDECIAYESAEPPHCEEPHRFRAEALTATMKLVESGGRMTCSMSRQTST
jgi:hypothetical protein